MPNSQQFRALESRMALAAKSRGMPLARYRRLVGFAVLIETLAEAVARGHIPLFFVKGGVAMELRLGLAARATKDLDIGFCVASEGVVAAFDGALAMGYNDFRLQRQGEARLLQNGARQLRVKLEYVENPFATVAVDLAPASASTETENVELIESRFNAFLSRVNEAAPFADAERGLTRERAQPGLRSS